MGLEITPNCLLFWVDDHFESVKSPKGSDDRFTVETFAKYASKYAGFFCIDTGHEKDNPEARYGKFILKWGFYKADWLTITDLEDLDDHPSNEMKAAMLLLDL